jgi:hypothetical protein
MQPGTPFAILISQIPHTPAVALGRDILGHLINTGLRLITPLLGLGQAFDGEAQSRFHNNTEVSVDARYHYLRS